MVFSLEKDHAIGIIHPHRIRAEMKLGSVLLRIWAILVFLYRPSSITATGTDHEREQKEKCAKNVFHNKKDRDSKLKGNGKQQESYYLKQAQKGLLRFSKPLLLERKC